jgi:hypothetical protein
MALSQSKKFREKLFVTSALERAGLGEHTASLIDSESPDFVVVINGRTIGIEVVEFFYPETDALAPRQFQILRDKSVQLARCKFRDRGGPPLSLVPVFKDYPTPSGPKNRREIEKFAERFQRTVSTYGWGIGVHDDRVIRQPADVPEIDYYFVYEVDDEDGELWGRGGPANGVLVEPRHVQDVLDGKAPKHGDYLERCDAVWLLIVNDGALRTAPCELGNDAQIASFVFPFERAFWFDHFPPGPLVELNCMIRGSSD